MKGRDYPKERRISNATDAFNSRFPLDNHKPLPDKDTSVHITDPKFERKQESQSECFVSRSPFSNLTAIGTYSVQHGQNACSSRLQHEGRERAMRKQRICWLVVVGVAAPAQRPDECCPSRLVLRCQGYILWERRWFGTCNVQRRCGGDHEEGGLHILKEEG